MFLNVFLTVFAFGTIIFIHELGHFLAARRVGVRVEKFYVGFDFWNLRLFRLTRGGTEYGVGIFPLGGYVKLAGQEDMGKAETKGEPDEFTSKGVWERSQILLAGVLFNFISAFVFSLLAILLGYRLVAPVAGVVVPGSPADMAGLKAGDRLLSYNGADLWSFSEIQTEVALGQSDSPRPVRVEREGRVLDLAVQPRLNERGFAYLGIMPAESLRVEAVEISSPAHKAGLRPDDLLVSAGGRQPAGFDDFTAIVSELGKGGKAVPLVVERDGERLEFAAAPAEPEHGFLGVEHRRRRLVERALPGSRAQASGLQPDDAILAVNRQDVQGLGRADFAGLSRPLTLVVADREGRARQVSYDGTMEDLERETGLSWENRIVVHKVLPGSAAAAMGLLDGDAIVNLEIEGLKTGNGAWYRRPVDWLAGREAPPQGVLREVTWSQFQEAVSASPGKKIALDVRREGRIVRLSGVVGTRGEEDGTLGLRPAPLRVECGPSAALAWPFFMLRTTYRSMLAIVTGRIPFRNVSGPVGIFRATYYLVSQTGLATLCYWLALISISLAFLNVLPIPVLDGGHLFFCLVEKIRGAPLPESVMNKLQYVGLSMILTLLVFATWNDIVTRISF